MGLEAVGARRPGRFCFGEMVIDSLGAQTRAPTPAPPFQGGEFDNEAPYSSLAKNLSITSFASRAGRSVSASRQHQLDLTSASTSPPRRITVS
jgi:hypothetical protein